MLGLVCTQPESTITSLDAALGLYDLAHYEWLREPVHDMNCLLAWNERMLVVAFRGTASLANVKADVKVRVSLLPLSPQLGTAADTSWLCGAVLARCPPACAWLAAAVLTAHGARWLPGQLAGAGPQGSGEGGRQALLAGRHVAALQ